MGCMMGCILGRGTDALARSVHGSKSPQGHAKLTPGEPVQISGADGLVADMDQLHLQAPVRVIVTKAQEGTEPARLTWSDAMEGLVSDTPSFRSLLTEVLQRMPFEAFLWECPPLSAETASSRLFEFVGIDAPHLANVQVDAGPFAPHLDAHRGQSVSRSFLNLGGDTLLVAPVHAAMDAQVYAHVAAFFRGAPEAQRDAQWQELGVALRERLGHVGAATPVWVSTAGAGVYWLHMRLDSKPKYYSHCEYLDPNFGLGTLGSGRLPRGLGAAEGTGPDASR